MQIKSQLTNRAGQVLEVIYNDVDSSRELKGKTVSGVHGFCFYDNKLVIVFAKNKGYWTPPGGGVEPGESVEQALIREVKEETNMHVISQHLIGYQDIFEPAGTITQTRSVCIVEPIALFKNDPDGEITEIKLIDPLDFKKYFDWGIVGEQLMKRALHIKETLLK